MIDRRIVMARCCKNLCVKHFGFEPRRRNLSLEERRKQDVIYMRNRRKGLSTTSHNHGLIDWEKFDYCSTCDAVVSKGKDFVYCPCCHAHLKKKFMPNVNTILLDILVFFSGLAWLELLFS